jgi:hypothetical protein
VETLTYGAQLVVAQIVTDMIIERRYILHMLRVSVDGPVLLLSDYNSMVLNTLVPSSVLKKKHHLCAYHGVHKVIAGGIMNFVHIKGIQG